MNIEKKKLREENKPQLIKLWEQSKIEKNPDRLRDVFDSMLIILAAKSLNPITAKEKYRGKTIEWLKTYSWIGLEYNGLLLE